MSSKMRVLQLGSSSCCQTLLPGLALDHACTKLLLPGHFKCFRQRAGVQSAKDSKAVLLDRIALLFTTRRHPMVILGCKLESRKLERSFGRVQHTSGSGAHNADCMHKPLLVEHFNISDAPD
jgi:hypothetical protein